MSPPKHASASWLVCALAFSCAGNGARPRPAAAVAAAQDPCGTDAFAGPWLLGSGTATLTCDDGHKTTVPAGGNIKLDPADIGTAGLAMVEGRCRYPLSRSGCALTGGPGVTCTDDGVRYTSLEVKVARDESGVFTLVYALEQPDPDDARKKCVASTDARMIRAARGATACALPGGWESSTTSDGKPARTALLIESGRCTVEAPGIKASGRCQFQGDVLTIVDDGDSAKGTCRAGPPASYTVTFTENCAAIELEARSDACQARRDAIEFLLLSHQR
jgi:hypothetical protein